MVFDVGVHTLLLHFSKTSEVAFALFFAKYTCTLVLYRAMQKQQRRVDMPCLLLTHIQMDFVTSDYFENGATKFSAVLFIRFRIDRNTKKMMTSCGIFWESRASEVSKSSDNLWSIFAASWSYKFCIRTHKCDFLSVTTRPGCD